MRPSYWPPFLVTTLIPCYFPLLPIIPDYCLQFLDTVHTSYITTNAHVVHPVMEPQHDADITFKIITHFVMAMLSIVVDQHHISIKYSCLCYLVTALLSRQVKVVCIQIITTLNGCVKVGVWGMPYQCDIEYVCGGCNSSLAELWNFSGWDSDIDVTFIYGWYLSVVT